MPYRHTDHVETYIVQDRPGTPLRVDLEDGGKLVWRLAVEFSPRDRRPVRFELTWYADRYRPVGMADAHRPISDGIFMQEDNHRVWGDLLRAIRPAVRRSKPVWGLSYYGPVDGSPVDEAGLDRIEWAFARRHYEFEKWIGQYRRRADFLAALFA